MKLNVAESDNEEMGPDKSWSFTWDCLKPNADPECDKERFGAVANANVNFGDSIKQCRLFWNNGFEGFNVASGKSPSPYNDYSNMDCGAEWKCFPGMQYKGCGPKYKFARLRRGYMGYPPGEGVPIPWSTKKEYFRGEMLEGLGIDGSDSEPVQLTSNNFRTIEAPIPCRFEDPVRFFVNSDTAATGDTGVRYIGWPCTALGGCWSESYPIDPPIAQFNSWDRFWGCKKFCLYHLCDGKGCSQSGHHSRTTDTITPDQWKMLVFLFLQWINGILDARVKSDWDKITCSAWTDWVINTDAASGIATLNGPEYGWNQMCTEALLPWVKNKVFPADIETLKNAPWLYKTLSECRNAHTMKIDNNLYQTPLCVPWAYNPQAIAKNPVAACTEKYLSTIAALVYFGSPSTRPKDNEEHYDGALISGWTPINVYGAIKSDGTPSNTRIRAVVDEVNIRKSVYALLTVLLYYFLTRSH